MRLAQVEATKAGVARLEDRISRNWRFIVTVLVHKSFYQEIEGKAHYLVDYFG